MSSTQTTGAPKKAGEFFTPRSVVRLMARILDPKEAESICDPACGSGGLLVESVNEVREAGGDARTLRLYGQEVNQTTAAIARMNLYLHDIETFKIARGDTLREPKLLDENGALQRFDMIVANPPFSLKSWGREGWAEDPHGRAALGVPPAAYGDLAFVEHMLTTMKENTGRMAVVMPNGVFFRRGAERDIRARLCEAGVVDAVITLAPNLFYNTPIPACVLVCRGSLAAEQTDHILFVDASRRFRKGRTQNSMDLDDVEAIVSAYQAGPSDASDDVLVRRVSLDEVRSNGFDLNVTRYLATDEEARVEIGAALAAYAAARQTRRAAESDLDASLTEIGLEVP